MVISLEWFMATKEPMDLRARIWEAQQLDLFVKAHRELTSNGRAVTLWTYTENLLRFHLYVSGGPLHGIVLHQCYDILVASHFGVFKILHHPP